MVITISREFGSGGHSIGMQVAEKLGIPFYDGEIVDEVSKKSGYSPEFIEKQGEYIKKKSTYFNLSIPFKGCYEDPRDKVFHIQKETIIQLAKEGPFVIVGRCGDYILKKEEIPCFNVFIYADDEHRKARVLERYGKNDVDIVKRLEQKDRQRRTYFKYYTDEDWGICKNYHLCLDSGFLEEEKCVKFITRSVRGMIEKNK